jgi:hypothetical protein
VDTGRLHRFFPDMFWRISSPPIAFAYLLLRIKDVFDVFVDVLPLPVDFFHYLKPVTAWKKTRFFYSS